GEGLLAHLVGRRDIVRRIEVTIVDLRTRHEAVDLDRVGTLDLDRLDLRVFDLDVLSLGHFVAAADVFLLDRISSLGIYKLLLQPVSGLLVDPVERDALSARGSGIERDRTRDQRQLEIPLPVGTRGHGRTPDAKNEAARRLPWVLLAGPF